MSARKKEGSVHQIKVTQLIVDSRYQRRLDEADVGVIVGQYEERLFRPLEVSVRAGGKYAVLDGQHRLAAAKEMGFTSVPCRIHRGLTQAEEAELFLRFDEGVRIIHAFDRFNAGVQAGRETPVAVMSIVESAGLELTCHRKDFSVTATRAMSAVHEKYDNPGRVLNILTEWQEGAADAYDGTFIRDLGALLFEHPDASDARCVSALKKVSPRELKRFVKAAKIDFGCTRPVAGVRVLRQLYNERCPRRLPRLLVKAA